MVGNRAKVRADLKRNRLYCAWEGTISKSELDAYFTEVRFGVADLTPGFTTILDLTACSLVYLDMIESYKKIEKYLFAQGVREVVRIVSDEHLVRTQLENLSLYVQGYEPIYVSSLEEAEEHLENSVKRGSIRLKLSDKQIEYLLGEQSYFGFLLDISLGGCGVKTEERKPESGQEIQVKIDLFGKQKQDCCFELGAKVVRLFEGGFALEFKTLSEQDRQMLNDCIAQESTVEIQRK